MKALSENEVELEEGETFIIMIKGRMVQVEYSDEGIAVYLYNTQESLHTISGFYTPHREENN